MRLLACAVAMTFAHMSAQMAFAETLARPDGSAIYYTLDRTDRPAKGLIVIAQGSGCMKTADSEGPATIRAAFADHAALLVEKAGVMPDAQIADGFNDCPEAFHQQHTLSQRVADYRAVLAQVRTDPAMAALPLLLFGGSEGGLAMARLAALEAPKATIILSSATGQTLGETILGTLPPEGQKAVSAAFDAARAAPSGDVLFAGSSHRFWADIVDQRALDHMLEAHGAFLLIQGGLDQSSPPVSSRPTLEAFSKAEKCNLTYWEFPGLDHGMQTPNGTSQMAEIGRMAAQWAEDVKPSC